MKTALVTGSSRGIGAATAALLAENGYSVCINYIERWDKAEERERRMAENLGLIYPENKKAADAGTSTAARETGGKD